MDLGLAADRDAGPFLKWAGGKTQLLPELAPFFPPAIPSYAEPFVGSGAVFFHLRARGALTGRVLLADINPELIHVFRVVQGDVESLLTALADHKAVHSRDHYYAVRARPFTEDVAGAARTIYLNKTGYNGLYRVNSKGEFNVPLGSYKRPGIFAERVLRAASLALQGVELRVQCFEETIGSAGAGDLLYLDPPYVPLSPTSSFTGYHQNGFKLADQRRLAETLRAADARGARFVLSNSYTEVVCELYDGFRIACRPVRRQINCDGTRRGPVKEAIVANFELGAEE